MVTTLFASMYAAYDNLSAPIKEMVENLKAFHEGVPRFSWSLLDPSHPTGREMLDKMKTECPGAIHPVVRRHPENRTQGAIRQSVLHHPHNGFVRYREPQPDGFALRAL